MDRFPIPATAKYSYESGFAPPRHMGVDIMAPLHSLLVAVEPGKVWSSVEPKGGNVVYLLGDSGARYFYGHLESWAGPGMITATAEHPIEAWAGMPIGNVGTTGNAQGGPPHVHFQIRRGADVVDPFPELYAADPHKRGEIPEPGVLDRIETGLSAGAMGLGNAIGMLALLWVLVNASKGK
jgi:murein DD-endopeptidase MepM/ murein hydrolase activator NlpD